MPRARAIDKLRRDKREGRHWSCKKKKMGKEIIRKVSIVFGKWGKKTDFVLEPVCPKCEKDSKECEVCKDHIYIKEEKQN